MAAFQKDTTELEMAKTLSHIPWCEQYEKMVSGMLYDSFVPDLEAARLRARVCCHQYNSFDPQGAKDTATLTQLRLTTLRKTIGHIADDELYIEPPFRTDYGCNISFGKRFYAGFNLTILDCALVRIGDRVMIGPNVSIFTATHEVEVDSRRQNIEYARPISIGNDCWIGGHVVILPGVSIGSGCTIAAGAVVTKDIPSWSVAMGAPARVVKKLTPLNDEM